MSVNAFVSSDVFVDWKQNVNEVTVRLRCGDGVSRVEDICTNFTDTHCHVLFPGESSTLTHIKSKEQCVIQTLTPFILLCFSPFMLPV